MTSMLELPLELERELSAEEARQRLPLSEYALRRLATGRSAREMPKTGAEVVHYWQSGGLIGSRSNIEDSQARQLREQAEQRVRK